MKKIIFLLLAIISASIVFGQTDQKKVAVYVTGGQDAGINKVLGDQLVAAFVNSGKYIAIERTSSFLAQLGKEQNYQRTGIVDDNELSRLGKQFGVQLVCVAEVNDVFGQKYISARLIDVESAEVLNAANESSILSNMKELVEISAHIAEGLIGKTEEQKEKEELKKAGVILIGHMTLYLYLSGTIMSWEMAEKSCQESNVGGYYDWRLPTINELQIIYNYYPKPFQLNVTWSSEEYTGGIKGEKVKIKGESRYKAIIYKKEGILPYRDGSGDNASVICVRDTKK